MSNNLNKYITVKYFAESEYDKVPYQATEGAAGYDLFAAETKTLLPKSTDTIYNGQFQVFSVEKFFHDQAF